MAEPSVFRIGELSRRSGVSPELLRAWERRYGLLDPTRSKGGLRLYSPDDLERVQTMQRYLNDGMAAAEAATLVSRAGLRQLEPPGFMGLNYGHRTPLTTLAGQAMYGAVLGGLPQMTMT